MKYSLKEMNDDYANFINCYLFRHDAKYILIYSTRDKYLETMVYSEDFYSRSTLTYNTMMKTLIEM